LEKCIETVKSCIETVEKIGQFFTPPAHLIEIFCWPRSHQDIRLRQGFGETGEEKLTTDEHGLTRIFWY